MFLMFDIDTLEFKMETEHTATHNQIVTAVARIPPKGSKNAEIYYEGVVYTWV